MVAGTAVVANLLSRSEITHNIALSGTTGVKSRRYFGIEQVSEGTVIEGTSFKLASDMAVELLAEEDYFIAKTHLVDEYGIGASPEEAIRDLLTSLADYLSSLERRQQQLGAPMARDLQSLRTLLKMR